MLNVPSKLTLLDPYELYPSNINNTTIEDLDLRYNRVLGKAEISLYRSRKKYFSWLSSPGCIDDTFFDVIYIDGDHTYNGCLSDLNRSLPLLSDRGLLIIDDYLPLYAEDTDQLEYGIIHAVSDFLSEITLSLFYHPTLTNCFSYIHPIG